MPKSPRPTLERFWEKIIKAPEGQCWDWSGVKNECGYAMLNVHIAPGKTKKVRASRISYEALVGPIADGGFVCHRCDNPACVNPEHLFIGTHAENMRDMALKKRSPHGPRHHATRLTEKEVKAIRSDKRTHTVIAEEYGVRQPCISRIKSGKNWRHLD